MNHNGDRDVCALVSKPPSLVSEQNVGHEVHQHSVTDIYSM